METKNRKGRKFRGVIGIVSGIVLITIVITVLASWMLYGYTAKLLTENLRQRLLSIAITQASNIQAEDLAALNQEEDWQKPEWSRVVNRLKKTKENNDDIVFMYIFRKTAADPTQMEFVADAESINPYANTDETSSNDVDANGDGLVEPDGSDKLQWPGQPYPEAVDIPEAFAAYNGPLTSEELYTDSYGQFLTGYAPIKDNSGNVVAILATDIKGVDFFTISRQTLAPFGLFVIFLIIVILVLALILIFMIKREVNAKEKIENLANNLQTANARLQALDTQKSEFVSLASHQLRGPLTAIKGYVSLILEGDYGQISADIKGALEKVQTSTNDLAILVGDYLDVSRIELGHMKYNFSAFSMNDLLEEVLNEMRPTIEKAGLKLSVDIDKLPSNVHADRNKIKQVVLNLLDNSVKYTPEGSIHVVLDRVDSSVLLTIKDTGVGMKKEVIPNLFAKFSRAPNASKTNIIGTGLGLYVAKQIVNEHGGEIWAESEGEGKGSKFSLKLKLV